MAIGKSIHRAFGIDIDKMHVQFVTGPQMGIAFSQPLWKSRFIYL